MGHEALKSLSTDCEHTILYWSSGAEDLDGVIAKNAVGRKLTEVYSYRWVRPEDEQKALAAL